MMHNKLDLLWFSIKIKEIKGKTPFTKFWQSCDKTAIFIANSYEKNTPLYDKNINGCREHYV